MNTIGSNILTKPHNLAYFSSRKSNTGNNSEKPENNQIISFQGAQTLRSMALSHLSFKGITGAKKFSKLATYPNYVKNADNSYWENCITRLPPEENDDPEFAFQEDGDRIINSDTFIRLRGKTQSFMLPQNDHVTTRINHVLYVEHISRRMANKLGLNAELVSAIALGHDLGHAPFGHEGERALQAIMEKNKMKSTFWHAQNGIKFADKIDKLNLSYAVRDGIICHSGKVQGALFPRNNFIKDLHTIKKPYKDENGELVQTLPYTWEGCVVKIADDISYLAKDIDDAINNKTVPKQIRDSLRIKIQDCLGRPVKENINSLTLTNGLVENLCNNSSPETGLNFSAKCSNLIKTILEFNKENIYEIPEYRFDDDALEKLETIFNKLNECYKPAKTETLDEIRKNSHSPTLADYFEKWLKKYSNITGTNDADKLYDIEKEEDYKQAIIDFISAMTDRFAVSLYKEIKSEPSKTGNN